MRITIKNTPRLRLADLLKRRKMTLKQFMSEFGITTHEGLVIRCDRMGVAAPSELEFKQAAPEVPVNNPPEGVIVVEPFNVISEQTGKTLDTDDGQTTTQDVVLAVEDSQPEPTEPSQKRPRRKKDVLPNDR